MIAAASSDSLAAVAAIAVAETIFSLTAASAAVAVIISIAAIDTAAALIGVTFTLASTAEVYF